MQQKPISDQDRAQRVLARIEAHRQPAPQEILPPRRCICCGAPADKVRHD